MAFVNKTETINYKGLTVLNVPYKEHDYPCECGCGENMKSRSTGVIIRTKFILNKYMTKNNLQEFDYNNCSEIEDEFKKWWYEERKFD